MIAEAAISSLSKDFTIAAWRFIALFLLEVSNVEEQMVSGHHHRGGDALLMPRKRVASPKLRATLDMF
jgi:hypothetical protein